VVFPASNLLILGSMSFPVPPSTTGILTFNWGNDGLNYFVPAEGLRPGNIFHDDDGFTNDLSLNANLERGESEFQFFGRHRMITEREGLHREDEVLTEARWGRRVKKFGRGELSSFLGLGLVATGPLGGAQLQDNFHGLTHWGRRLNGEGRDQLQSIYEGGVLISPRLAVGGNFRYPVSDQTQVSLNLEVDASHNVGVSKGELAGEVERHWEKGRNRFSLWVDFALRHLHSEEDRLSFHGGYPKEATFLEPTLGFSYSRGAKRIGFSLILNQEGTGVNQGVLSLSYLLGQ